MSEEYSRLLRLLVVLAILVVQPPWWIASPALVALAVSFGRDGWKLYKRREARARRRR